MSATGQFLLSLDRGRTAFPRISLLINTSAHTHLRATMARDWPWEDTMWDPQESDVVIVGAGLAGLRCASVLEHAGLSVTVLAGGE